MIARKIKSLKKLNRKERYSEKRELLANAELNVTFNEAQLIAFLDSSYVKSFGDDNSQESRN